MATDTKPTLTGSAARGSLQPDALRGLAAVWLPAICVFLGTLGVFLATQTGANTFDAISYANQIAHLYPRTGDPHWLFHPHHLLFNALGYVLWRTARLLGYVGGPLAAMQTLNSVLGAAGATLYYLTLRSLMRRSRWLSLLVALGLSFSFGWWICATDGRVNLPSTFLLLCAFAAQCRLMQTPTPKMAALVGLLSGGAVLLHESAGLFVMVGLAGVLLAEDDPLLLPAAMRLRRRQMLLAYGAAWIATVGLPYLIVGVFALNLHSVGAFRAWSNAYSELGWWWDFRVIHNLRLDLYALRHAAFVEPPGKAGTFHLSRHVPLALSVLYYATLLGWFGAVLAFVVALPLLWRSHNRHLMLVCVLWIVVYAAFFTVWSPGYFVFWVPVLIPIGVILALVLAHYRARRGGLLANWLVALWIVLYAALNAEAGILPHLAPSSDPFRRIAADVRAHTQPGDIVLVAGAGDGGPCEVALPYFADREVVSVHGLLTKQRDDKAAAFGLAQSQMNTALISGHAVYALDEVVPMHNPHTLAALTSRHHITDGDLKALLQPYTRTLAWHSPRGPVWRLIPVDVKGQGQNKRAGTSPAPTRTP